MNELPGFFTPGAPNAEARSFAAPRQPIEFLVQDNVPLDTPLPTFEFKIGKAFGNQRELYAIGDGAQVIRKEGLNPGTKAYWARIMPDELRLLNGTYLIRVTANGQEIFRTSLTMGYDG